MTHYTSLLLSISGVLIALTVILMAIRKTAAFARRMVHLIDEVIGKEGISGQPSSLGISARLSAIESQLRPNGGSSLADKIDRLEGWTVSHSLAHADENQRYRSKRYTSP